MPLTASLGTLRRYIDWQFFFTAWELKGKFPGILEHPKYGPAARELYEHAQHLLQRIVDDRLLTARGVYGFWPANSDGDDIVVYTDESRTTERLRFNMLRQQQGMLPLHRLAQRAPHVGLRRVAHAERLADGLAAAVRRGSHATDRSPGRRARRPRAW